MSSFWKVNRVLLVAKGLVDGESTSAHRQVVEYALYRRGRLFVDIDNTISDAWKRIQRAGEAQAGGVGRWEPMSLDAPTPKTPKNTTKTWKIISKTSNRIKKNGRVVSHLSFWGTF